MKMTKKAMKEAPRYIMTLDPKTRCTPNADGFYKSLGAEYYYKALTAENLLDAMTEADSHFDDTTYIITIAEKTGTYDIETKSIIYKEILSSRSEGNWHRCDSAHHETPFAIAYDSEIIWFGTLCEAIYAE